MTFHLPRAQKEEEEGGRGCERCPGKKKGGERERGEQAAKEETDDQETKRDTLKSREDTTTHS